MFLWNYYNKPSCSSSLKIVAYYTIYWFLFQIPINTTNAQPFGQQLVAFTSKAAHFTDVMDVIYVTHLVERLTRLVEKHKDVRGSTEIYYIQCIYSGIIPIFYNWIKQNQTPKMLCKWTVKAITRFWNNRYIFATNVSDCKQWWLPGCHQPVFRLRTLGP